MEESVDMDSQQNKIEKEILNTLDAPLSQQDVRQLNPLVLAYIGDGVYEMYIREYLIKKKKSLVNQLHKTATGYVKAEAQAAIIHALMEELTEEETTIVKRGRNSKSGTMPKNANPSDYRYATGYEALVGYLHLSGQQERLLEVIVKSIKCIEGKADCRE